MQILNLINKEKSDIDYSISRWGSSNNSWGI